MIKSKKIKSKVSTPSLDGYKVKVVAISDTGTIITSGCESFDYGIIFQHGILYDSKPLPIDIACSFVSSNISIGRIIRILKFRK
jgi:hypothetical protein